MGWFNIENFKNGGEVFGPNHANGGVKAKVKNGLQDKIEVQGGEYVASKAAMKFAGPLIEKINSMGNKLYPEENEANNFLGAPLMPRGGPVMQGTGNPWNFGDNLGQAINQSLGGGGDDEPRGGPIPKYKDGDYLKPKPVQLKTLPKNMVWNDSSTPSMGFYPMDPWNFAGKMSNDPNIAQYFGDGYGSTDDDPLGEIQKWKTAFDEGTITEEEYNRKRKNWAKNQNIDPSFLEKVFGTAKERTARKEQKFVAGAQKRALKGHASDVKASQLKARAEMRNIGQQDFVFDPETGNKIPKYRQTQINNIRDDLKKANEMKDLEKRIANQNVYYDPYTGEGGRPHEWQQARRKQHEKNISDAKKRQEVQQLEDHQKDWMKKRDIRENLAKKEQEQKQSSNYNALVERAQNMNTGAEYEAKQLHETLMNTGAEYEAELKANLAQKGEEYRYKQDYDRRKKALQHNMTPTSEYVRSAHAKEQVQKDYLRALRNQPSDGSVDIPLPPDQQLMNLQNQYPEEESEPARRSLLDKLLRRNRALGGGIYQAGGFITDPEGRDSQLYMSQLSNQNTEDTPYETKRIRRDFDEISEDVFRDIQQEVMDAQFRERGTEWQQFPRLPEEPPGSIFYEDPEEWRNWKYNEGGGVPQNSGMINANALSQMQDKTRMNSIRRFVAEINQQSPMFIDTILSR
tara:strand:- start:40782 stop:42836 length:2055 start_codon:yes stop_codon:yes gene_type:complete